MNRKQEEKDYDSNLKKLLLNNEELVKGWKQQKKIKGSKRKK